MPTLLHHQKKVFEDQVVYAGGNAYTECVFMRCTIIVRDDSVFHHCTFDGCIYHLDIIIHDHEKFDFITGFLNSIVKPSLPVAPARQAPADPPLPTNPPSP